MIATHPAFTGSTIEIPEKYVKYIQRRFGVFVALIFLYKAKIFDVLIEENIVFWHILNRRTQAGLIL